MRFLSVRDLRGKSAQVWKELPIAGEMVVTNNGRPVAILSSVSEANVEERLDAIRRAEATAAIAKLQERSVASGRDKLTLAEINQEIAAVRRNRCR